MLRYSIFTIVAAGILMATTSNIGAQPVISPRQADGSRYEDWRSPSIQAALQRLVQRKDQLEAAGKRLLEQGQRLQEEKRQLDGQIQAFQGLRRAGLGSPEALARINRAQNAFAQKVAQFEQQGRGILEDHRQLARELEAIRKRTGR